MFSYHVYVNRERRKNYMDGTWCLDLPSICQDYRPYGRADSSYRRQAYGHILSVRVVLIQWENGHFQVYDDTTYLPREMRYIGRSKEWKHRALYEGQAVDLSPIRLK